MTKLCKRCTRPTGNPDGRQWYCRACRVERNRETARASGTRRRVLKPCARCGGPKGPGERRWYCDTCEPLAEQERRETARRRTAEWYADPVNAERQSQRARGYRLDAQRRIASAERLRAWTKANRERVRELTRRSNRRRRAALRGVRSEYIDELIVLERDDGICGICGGDVDPLNFHIDHVVPIVLRGDNTYGNVQLAHPRCNLAKGARLDFAA